MHQSTIWCNVPDIHLVLHRRRKQIWSVQATAVLREALSALKKKWKVTRLRIFSKCPPLDCKIEPFLTVYNILVSFSDLPVQYSIYVENWVYCLRRHSQETARLAFVACSIVSLKICISFRTEPSHYQDFDHLIVYFNRKCTHVTACETDATKRLLDLSLAPREQASLT